MVKAGHQGGQVREAGLVEPSRDPASRGFVGHREGCGCPFTAVGSFPRVLNKAATNLVRFLRRSVLTAMSWVSVRPG